MPGMTGDELIEVLQADPDLREIPIIMATAASRPTRVRRVVASGCRAVVAKPMDEATFLAAVRSALTSCCSPAEVHHLGCVPPLWATSPPVPSSSTEAHTSVLQTLMRISYAF